MGDGEGVVVTSLLRCNALKLGKVYDDEVRFAKVVATPYLLRCKDTVVVRSDGEGAVVTPAVALQGCWGVGVVYDDEVRFAKVVATPYLWRCKTLGWRRAMTRRHRYPRCGIARTLGSGQGDGEGAVITPTVALQGRWGVGRGCDGEVRFAKVVVTPAVALQRCCGAGVFFRRRGRRRYSPACGIARWRKMRWNIIEAKWLE